MGVNVEAVRSILTELYPAKLVAATKYATVEDLYQLEASGITIFGENIAQDFLVKYQAYQGGARWHFIGTLQTNKVKYIIDKVELIHSVDSYKLIDEIQRQAAKHGLVMPVLLQVNIAKEASKHGFTIEEVDRVIAYLFNCPNIKPIGLMMMAPDIELEKTRVYFQQTKFLLDKLNKQIPMTELSMGMSNDYQVALTEGATLVRIGRALFD